MERPSVTVRVSPELLAEFGEWSRPLQVQIVERGGEYDMTFREPQPTAPALAEQIREDVSRS